MQVTLLYQVFLQHFGVGYSIFICCFLLVESNYSYGHACPTPTYIHTYTYNYMWCFSLIVCTCMYCVYLVIKCNCYSIAETQSDQLKLYSILYFACKYTMCTCKDTCKYMGVGHNCACLWFRSSLLHYLTYSTPTYTLFLNVFHHSHL